MKRFSQPAKDRKAVRDLNEKLQIPFITDSSKMQHSLVLAILNVFFFLPLKPQFSRKGPRLYRLTCVRRYTEESMYFLETKVTDFNDCKYFEVELR